MSYDFYVELADERLDEVIRLRAENEKLRAELKDNISFIRKQADEIAELRKAAALREMGHE